LASIELTSESVTNRALLFRAGATAYGCAVGAVQEIIPWRAATRLPGTPPWVRGLINVRGAIVTVIDLGARLGSESPDTDPDQGFILLVRYRDRVVGVRVDAVLDVRDVGEDPIPSAPADGGIARALARTDDGMNVVLLDLDALLQQVLLS
jgi:purine-binding chemotaxis protein CheW